MANPQAENGYVRIANEIVEALARTNLSAYETRYLWVLLRKTYGFNKKEDVISNSQFVDLSGIDKSNVRRAERRLIWRNIVVKIDNIIRFNKDYTQWRELSITTTVKNVVSNASTVVHLDNKTLSQSRDTKDIKYTLQKTTGPIDIKNIIENKDMLISFCREFNCDMDQVKQTIQEIKDRKISNPEIYLKKTLSNKFGLREKENIL